MKAIYVETPGGPEVMEFIDVPALEPKAGEVVVTHKAIGVNYIDIYFRKGLYPLPTPIRLGYEASGVVKETGSALKDFRVGDRVAYMGVLGAYAEENVVPSECLVKLPDKISFKEGAGAMVQGITAQYLTHSTYPLKKGDMCLVHAAAGGVGLLLCQVAKFLGAVVIGTVSTEGKARFAKNAGCDYPVIYTKQDFVQEVKNITRGKGVHVVYDGVGASTFEKSLDCLAPRGMMVLFGQSSGPVPPFDLNILNRKGSLFLTRPGINSYVATREELLGRANDVFEWMTHGKLKITIHHEFPLKEASSAHKALESRQTTGKILLLP